MKRIFQTLAQKWPEYLLEILVISIGILVAFGLNSWNEERKENAMENQFLQNLKAEVLANQKSLAQNINWHKGIYDHMVQFMELTGPEAVGIDQVTFDSLVYSTIRLPSYNPVKGNISSNELDDLEAAQLKASIAKWIIKMEDYQRSVKIIYDQNFEFIYPELSKSYQLKNMKGAENSFALESQFIGNQMEILRNLTFENHLTMRAINARIIYTRSLEIHDLQVKIIEQIDNRLEKL